MKSGKTCPPSVQRLPFTTFVVIPLVEGFSFSSAESVNKAFSGKVFRPEIVGFSSKDYHMRTVEAQPVTLAFNFLSHAGRNERKAGGIG
jgi:hypothetical protein